MTMPDDRDTIAVRVHTETAPDTHSVQQTVEGTAAIDEDGKIEFMGERFKVAESIGLMPLLKFAHVSKKGVDSADIEGLAAMYAMIRDCIDTEPSVRHEQDARTGEQTAIYGPSEWDRFEAHATETKATDVELFDVVTKVIEVVSARPTERRSGSSTGSPATSGTSRASSTSPATPGDSDDLVPVGSLLGP